jgi:hypothetical protein
MSSTWVDYVPALCTYRPSLLPIEWLSEASGLSRRVGGLEGVLSHAVASVSRFSLCSAPLWYVLGWGEWPTNGSASSPTATNGPECSLARRRAGVVHEEGAPVGDEGLVRVTLLLLLLVARRGWQRPLRAGKLVKLGRLEEVKVVTRFL